MSGIVQEPGFDTKVRQFTPIRSAPVWKRAVRKYHCEEDIANSSTFQRLQFKVHCQERNLVMNDVRLVLPLELTAWKGDFNDPDANARQFDMSVGQANPACNIAIAQNAPWGAFETISTVVNTKVYTEKPRSYGDMLSKCYQSVSEMQFQNNHSLKPIANMNIYGAEPVEAQYDVVDHTGIRTARYVGVEQYQFSPGTFSLQNANSGFLERSRDFQQNLSTDGTLWKGEISSLLNTGPFSSESRGQGNDQIPYVEDLFLSCVFKQTKCQVDTVLFPSRFPDYRKVLPQCFFEFLTPCNQRDPGDRNVGNVDTRALFPDFYEIKWTAKPYIQVEWLQYAPSAMLPMYRLQGFQYKLRKSNEFVLPIRDPSFNKITVPVRVSMQCLSVPNKIYIWAEGTETSMRKSFLWGGLFRTCEIVNKTLKVRVNGESHVIDRPDNQSMLFKWFKRHSNSVQEYPTWRKNMVIILTPNEIGLNSWLENDSQLSTIEVSCDVRLSDLQQVEFQAAEASPFLEQSGVRDTRHNATATRTIELPAGGPDVAIYWSDQLSKQMTGHGKFHNYHISSFTTAGIAGYLVNPMPQFSDDVTDLLEDFYIRNKNIGAGEWLKINRATRTFVVLKSSIWVKYDRASRQFVSGLFFVRQSYLFEFSKHIAAESEGVIFCPWSAIQAYDTFHVPVIQVDGSGNPLDLDEYVIRGRTFYRTELQWCMSHFNAPDPEGDILNSPGSAPGPKAQFRSSTAGQYFNKDFSGQVEATEPAYQDSPSDYTLISPGQDQDLVWICMQPQGQGDTDAHWFKYDSGPGEIFVTQAETHFQCDVSRGQQGSDILDVKPTIYNAYEFQRIAHETEVNKSFQYELNCLTEYSNQQIVMDDSRKIAVRVSNNVPVAR